MGTEQRPNRAVRYEALINGNVRREGKHPDQIIKVDMGYGLHAHMQVKAEVITVQRDSLAKEETVFSLPETQVSQK